MSKNVTVADVVQTGGTTKAPTMVLHYYGDDGKVWKIGNLAAKLDESSRTKLKTVQKGTKVAIQIKKADNGYWNLISVTDPVEESATNTVKKTTTHTPTYNKAYTQEGRLTDVEKAKGQQRGNVLTNAVNLVIASGKTGDAALAAIEVVVKRLLEISNKLETTNDNLENANQEVQASQDLDDPEVTEKLGF